MTQQQGNGGLTPALGRTWRIVSLILVTVAALGVALAHDMAPVWRVVILGLGLTGVAIALWGYHARERELAHEVRRAEQLDAVLRAMTDGIYVLDSDLNYILHNEQYGELLDIPEEIIAYGKPVEGAVRYLVSHDYYGDVAVEEFVAERMRAFHRREKYVVELVTPQERHLELRQAPLGDGGLVVVCSDITGRKKAESEMRRTNQKLKEYNDKIMEGIGYARMIQRALLPSTEMLQALLGEHMVWLRQRDMVGGDFYAVLPAGDGAVVAVGDCTGHGVPGAFMTMLAHSTLTQAVKDLGGADPGAVLSRVHRTMRAILHVDGADVGFDNGLDLGLCYVPAAGRDVVFSGGGQSVYQVHEGRVERIKGSNQALGYWRTKPDTVYPNHQVEVPEGAALFMASDGVLDQDGGAKGYPLGRRRFHDMLAEVADGPLDGGARRLQDALAEYQGDRPQRDDIVVLGFRPGTRA